jgi:urocanate hydratase
MTHVPLSGDKDDIEKLEKQVIARLQPPMNLNKWRNPQKKMVEELRKICREEARAGEP